MSALAFERLCAGFCEIAKVAAPTLQAEQNGIIAFNVEWRDVTVDVIYEPWTSGNHAFVLFTLGPTEQASHQPQQILLALLQANFLSLRVNPPTFSCHPETGVAALQCVFPLAESTPSGFFKFVDEGVNLALEWRKTFFLSDDQTDPALALQRSVPAQGFA